jgi:hypothetical protein
MFRMLQTIQLKVEKLWVLVDSEDNLRDHLADHQEKEVQEKPGS